MATDIEKIQNFAASYQADKNNKRHSYEFPTDDLATISAVGYFNAVRDNNDPFIIGDQMNLKGSDADGFFKITAITPDVTLAAIGGGGPPLSNIGTVNFDVSLFEQGLSAPTMGFAGSFAKRAQFINATDTGLSWQFPEDFSANTNLTINLRWSPTTANAGNVDWSLAYIALADGSSVTSPSFFPVVSTATPGVANERVTSTFVIDGATGGFDKTKHFQALLARDNTSTYADPNDLLNLSISYTRV